MVIIIDNDLKGYLAIKLNVSDYIKEKEKVEFLAYHDSLTLLLNRRALQRDIVEVLNDCKTNNKKFTILFIDLDGFKFINDGLGHDIGDILLKHVGDILTNTLREHDTVARLGGDEFVILLENIESIEYLDKTVSRINNLSSKMPLFYSQNIVINFTFSLGVSIFPYDGEDAETLLNKADKNMYLNKHGNN